MTRERWAYLAEGNANQARKRVAAKVVLRDTAGRLLLVNPSYKRFWDLPGGMAEANEAPRAAAEREVREELGLRVRTGELLVVDWVADHGPWDDHLVFVFAADALTKQESDSIALTDDELTAFEFVAVDEIGRYLRPDVAERTAAAINVLATGETAYREQTDPRYI